MKNRAKCKLCQSVIESFHLHDYVTCKCGEISITGGNDALQCSAIDWKNFLRVDDNDNEIIVKVKDKTLGLEETQADTSQEGTHQALERPNKKELMKMLESMIKSIEDLPVSAMTTPITHYDFVSGLLLLSAIFKSDLSD